MTNRKSGKKEIQFDEIPEKLNEGLHDYSTLLFGDRLSKLPVHCGTGTFVKSGGAHFILTARHCAERLSEYSEIGLPIHISEQPFLIQMQSPVCIGARKDDEWGPDLAFIPIHPVDVKRIYAVSNKIFYNLDRYKAEILLEEPRVENSLWAVVGAPILLSKIIGPREVELYLNAYKVRVERPTRKDDFDYVDIRVTLGGKNALQSFQGLSGGGLWQAEIQRNMDDSVVLVRSHRLVGCAFYETEAKGKYRYIRCHGWWSIYEQGLSRLFA